MARHVAPAPTVRDWRWLFWCLAALGASAGALLVICGAAVETIVGKLGAADSYTFEVQVLGRLSIAPR